MFHLLGTVLRKVPLVGKVVRIGEALERIVGLLLIAKTILLAIGVKTIGHVHSKAAAAVAIVVAAIAAVNYAIYSPEPISKTAAAFASIAAVSKAMDAIKGVIQAIRSCELRDKLSSELNSMENVDEDLGRAIDALGREF